MTTTIYSIGHSNLAWEDFRHLLEGPDIGCIVDVRSSPFSRWRHFRQHELRVRLNQIGISYVHLGVELGGRPETGPTDYQAMARAKSFLTGIDRLIEIAGRCKPVILCSEHEPLTCHRFLLVARHLVEHRGAIVHHILRDGRIEPHADTEERLLALHGGTDDLFADRLQQLDYAYCWQAQRLGAAG